MRLPRICPFKSCRQISDDFIPQTQIHTFNSELFLKEVDEYLSLYPHTQHIDICLHDL
ncbi:hypothetical protein, partial [Acinetobacter baumannii]|uniref:hypothetical protein n=1 Tax=Acinetobacter baumannii TaxID=470 RepID=UPI002278E42B